MELTGRYTAKTTEGLQINPKLHVLGVLSGLGFGGSQIRWR